MQSRDVLATGALVVLIAIGSYLGWRQPRPGWTTFVLILTASVILFTVPIRPSDRAIPLWLGLIIGLCLTTIGHLALVAFRFSDDTWPEHHDTAGRMPTRSKTFRPTDDEQFPAADN